MEILKEIEAYKQYIKQDEYMYSVQKQGIELFIAYLKKMGHSKYTEQTPIQNIDYFLAIWLPRNKKYLKEDEAFNVIYTLQDFQLYLREKNMTSKEIPIVLEDYRKDYARLYKAKKFIDDMVGDPIVALNPTIINITYYREKKERKKRKETMCMYEQGIFCIEEINKDGFIGLSKWGTDKYCKVLCRPNILQHFKVKDLLHVQLKKKIFFVYWDIDEIKAYYPKGAAAYL